MAFALHAERARRPGAPPRAEAAWRQATVATDAERQAAAAAPAARAGGHHREVVHGRERLDDAAAHAALDVHSRTSRLPPLSSVERRCRVHGEDAARAA